MDDAIQRVLGFDLGGSKMVCSVFDTDMNQLTRVKRKTDAHRGKKAVIKAIIGLVKDTATEAGIDVSDACALGIAVPGPVNPDEGVIHETPNLPFENLPLGKELKKALGLPVVLENDVNAGTYGEFIHGAAQGYRNVVGIFPGTGIGGGLILNGDLYRGATGSAGEVGHMIIQLEGPLCGCGQYGCLESLASRTAMSKDAVALAAAGAVPLTLKLTGTDFQNYKSKVYENALKNRETEIEKIINRAARHLGIGIANLVNILNPEIVVIGGGLVERLGKRYVAVAEESMREHAMKGIVEHVTISEAALGGDSVCTGAAGLALKASKAGA